MAIKNEKSNLQRRLAAQKLLLLEDHRQYNFNGNLSV
jgi:hypothetical protein